MSEDEAATVVVVPRETRSQVRPCLETLVANTATPYRLVIVESDYPAAKKHWLETFARAHDALLIRPHCSLTPNEARNVGLRAVDTKYVVFLDDNCFVREGWLDALIRCADETGAAIVGPMCGFRLGRHGRETVHVYGAEAHIESDDGRRHLVDEHLHVGMPLDEAVATLPRQTSEAAEFHCMLVRSDLFTELGPLDEALLSIHEHIDLSMLARDAGHEIWLEPSAVAVYEVPLPLPVRDRTYFALRWSRAWSDASCQHLTEKWHLEEGELVASMGWWADDRRGLAYKLSPPLLDRVFRRLGPTRLKVVDDLVQRAVLLRESRRRGAGREPRVVHAATWSRTVRATTTARRSQ